MKKKIFLIVIAVLVVCLMCGMLFVACNEKEENTDPGIDSPVDPGDPDDPVDPDDPDEPEVPDDEDYDPDVSSIKSASNAFVAIVEELHNVELNQEKSFNFGLQIMRKSGEADEQIFALTTEKVDGKDYLYGAVGTTVFTKFNGLDIGEVVYTVLQWLGPIQISDFIDMPIKAGLDYASMKNSIVAGILTNMAISDWDISDSGNAIMMELGIEKLLNTVIGFMGGVPEGSTVYQAFETKINEALTKANISADAVNTVVGVIAGLLQLEGEDIGIAEVFEALATTFSIKLYFGFDEATAGGEADPFDEMIPGVLAARGTYDPATDSFKDKEAKNLINFNGEIFVEAGTVQAAGGEVGEAAAEGEEPVAPATEFVAETNYVIDIDVDLNIFAMIGLLDFVGNNGKGVMEDGFKLEFKDFNVSDITTMIEDIGYIHISMDEVTVGEGGVKTPVKNVFTLHYDSAKGAAVVSATLVDQLAGNDYAIGGVYNVEALANLVDRIIKKTVAPAGGAAEGGFDFIGFVGKLMGQLGTFGSQAENGAIIANLEPVAEFLLNEFLTIQDPEVKAATIESVKQLIAPVFGGNVLRISVAQGAFTFGKQVTRIDYDELMFNLREDTELTGTNDDTYVESIVSIDGNIVVGGTVTVNGKDFAGEDVVTSGIIMDAVEVEGGTVYYVGILTDLAANFDGLKALIGQISADLADKMDTMPPSWPFYGVLATPVIA